MRSFVGGRGGLALFLRRRFRRLSLHDEPPLPVAPAQSDSCRCSTTCRIFLRYRPRPRAGTEARDSPANRRPEISRICSDGIVRRDQLFAPGRIHAVIAGRNRRRAADAHVNFGGACLAHQAHDLAAGGAAHDRIVHQNHALPFEHAAHRIQFQLHAEIADGLLRLDERAADVVIADQPHAKRNAGFRRVADRRRHARIGHRRDDVGFHGMLARQQASQSLRGSRFTGRPKTTLSGREK